ncbi:hypothetical protein FRC08_010734 [Ceratobasidium sp. 394]|nr:hypothetical protein FRC08_010734 [Ceratobasidium sp. 394]KAG9082194.1 hypothetical protein FS749_007038 [Ceratobasidium sp. UAMH 11750]
MRIPATFFALGTNEPHTGSSPIWPRGEPPAYCTRVEILNKPCSQEASTQPSLVAVAAVAESHSGDYTFATSPFTSPPVFAMEIFITKEEVVVSDEVVPAGRNRTNSTSVDINGETTGKHML